MDDKEKERVIRMIRAFCRQYGVHTALAEQVKEDTASTIEKLGLSMEDVVGAFSLDREEDPKAAERRRSLRQAAEKRGRDAASSRQWNQLLREIAPGRLKMGVLFNLVQQYQAITARLPECSVEALDDLLTTHSDKFSVMGKVRNGIMHIPHSNPETRESSLFHEAGDLPRFCQELETHIHPFFVKVVDRLTKLRKEPERQ